MPLSENGPKKETVSGLFVHGLADRRKAAGNAESREGERLSPADEIIALFKKDEVASLDGARVAVDHMLAHSGIKEADLVMFANKNREIMKGFIGEALQIMMRTDGGREKDSRRLFEKLRDAVPSSSEDDYKQAA